MFLYAFFAFVVMLQATCHVTSFGKNAVKSSLSVPKGWVIQPVPPSRDLAFNIRFALRYGNFEGLEKALGEISDPSHPRWTKHLTKAEVERFVSPTPDTMSIVDDYLASNGVDLGSVERSPAKDWISFNVTIARAERLLGTKYATYKSEISGAYVVRSSSYRLPEYLHSHIDSVQPTNYFGDFLPRQQVEKTRTTNVSSNHLLDTRGDSVTTIQSLQKLYNVGNYTPVPRNNNVLGIAGCDSFHTATYFGQLIALKISRKFPRFR